MKQAKETGDKATVQSLKEEVKKLQYLQRKIKGEIEKATESHTSFYRAAKPYLDAKRTLVQIENYEHLDEIMALYNQIKG